MTAVMDRTSPATAATAATEGFGAKFVIAAAFGSVLNPVNSSIIAVALTSIGRAFGAGADRTAWLVSALYLATAIGQPTMGRLADLVGPRKIYLLGTILVTLGGLIGALATGLPQLIASRTVIGFGTSAAYPAAMTLVRRRAAKLNRETPGSVLGLLAITGQVSMAVGPPLGGLLIALGGWRLTFWVNVPLALAGLIAAGCWLPADDQRDTSISLTRQLDPAGLALFALSLTGLLFFLMDLAAPKWWLLTATAGALAALVARERRAQTPFIDVRLLAHNRALTTTYVRFGVTMLITYCFIYGWTEWLEQVAGATALLIGSLALTTLHAHSPLWVLLAVSAVFGLQNGLNIVSNQAAMYAQAPANATGAAAGLLRTSMYLGAIASASLIGLCFGRQATDTGLHHLAVILVIASTVLVVNTFVDRNGPVRQ